MLQWVDNYFSTFIYPSRFSFQLPEESSVGAIKITNTYTNEMTKNLLQRLITKLKTANSNP